MLHFSQAEFDRRAAAARAGMAARALDGMLLFAPESQYWLTGYDTFGYCFFQCLVLTQDHMALVTRSADLRQAELTSTLKDIRVWKDGAGVDPSADLLGMLRDLGLTGKRLGWETDTHGLTMKNGLLVQARLAGEATLVEASDLFSTLRLKKSAEEISLIRRAAELADDAYDAAMAVIRPGADEGEILAAMQGAIFAGGGDYPGNEFIIGSGEHALLCRYQAAKGRLGDQDQLTLEWAGTYRHYHAALMRTVVVGAPGPVHADMHAAARDALLACEGALTPGQPMGKVFQAHAETMDGRGYGQCRLNACGYALGARFAPSWMEAQMFYEGAPTLIEPGQVFFLHMILMDSDSGAAMSLGRTSLVTETGAEPLSRLSLDLPRAG